MDTVDNETDEAIIEKERSAEEIVTSLLEELIDTAMVTSEVLYNTKLHSSNFDSRVRNFQTVKG